MNVSIYLVMLSVSEASHCGDNTRFFAPLRMTIVTCHAERSEASLRFLAPLKMTDRRNRFANV